jgi:hypothetical protein
VACFGLPVMLGRNGQCAEQGRGYRHEESKREEETIRTDHTARGSRRLVKRIGILRAGRACEELGQRAPRRTSPRLNFS